MTSDEKKMLYYFSVLGEEHRSMVMEFIEFLGSKYPNELPPAQPTEFPDEQKKIIEPELTPRPDTESVIAAIKRLSQSYPMLNKEKLFDKTSTLMTAHIMQGRDVVEVIDEIQLVFESHYEEYVSEKKGS
jgi:hypothetical protein